jgi:uncharacterized membrane protein
VVPNVGYDGLTDTMFHMIRQSAAANAAVLIRMLEVLTAVVSCEREPRRIASLQRHADLVLSDGEREIEAPADLNDLRDRHRLFGLMRHIGPAACV